jgi:hypothetical protein
MVGEFAASFGVSRVNTASHRSAIFPLGVGGVLAFSGLAAFAFVPLGAVRLWLFLSPTRLQSSPLGWGACSRLPGWPQQSFALLAIAHQMGDALTQNGYYPEPSRYDIPS